MKTITMKPISWTAILAGALVGVGVNFLLNLLALGLAMACFSVALSGKTEFSFFGFMWFWFSAILAMFTTGWVAGILTPPLLPHRAWGILYGFLAWALLLIITVIIITNMIQFTAFHGNFTSNLVAVKLTNNAPMLTETVSGKVANAPLSINLELGKKVIVLNAFLTFLLFCTGGIASCIGGYLGYQPLVPLEKES